MLCVLTISVDVTNTPDLAAWRDSESTRLYYQICVENVLAWIACLTLQMKQICLKQKVIQIS